MKKIAVFGKPSNGKSTLSKRIATATNIKLYALDSILYEPSGQEIERSRYNELHDNILSSDEWIIEGFGPLNSLESFNKRLDEADTLIYLDLPYSVTYWLVIKRFLKGLFITPEGWPEGSSILQGTVQSFKILKHCPKFWNESFLNNLQKRSSGKSLYIVRTLSELNGFVRQNIN